MYLLHEKGQPLSSIIPTAALISLDFSLTVKAAPNECVIRTSQP